MAEFHTHTQKITYTACKKNCVAEMSLAVFLGYKSLAISGVILGAINETVETAELFKAVIYLPMLWRFKVTVGIFFFFFKFLDII